MPKTQMIDPKWGITKAEMYAYLDECLKWEAQQQIANPDVPPNNSGIIIAAIQTTLEQYSDGTTLGEIWDRTWAASDFS